MFRKCSSGLHPTLSDISLSAIKTNANPTKPMIEFAKQQGQFKPENFAPFDRLQIVTVQEILDGKRMNLPLMEEVTKRAQKAKQDNQTGFNFE